MRNIKNILKNDKILLMLVGPPLVGKSTWIKKEIDLDKFKVISRDELLLKVSNTDNYEVAWKNSSQSYVSKLLIESIIESNKNGDSVIIDMTNMTPKRRKSTLSFYDDDYFKAAIVFPFLTNDEYDRRNKIRYEKENKNIPMSVIKNMLKSYRAVTKEEGFDVIIYI